MPKKKMSFFIREGNIYGKSAFARAKREGLSMKQSRAFSFLGKNTKKLRDKLKGL